MCVWSGNAQQGGELSAPYLRVKHLLMLEEAGTSNQTTRNLFPSCQEFLRKPALCGLMMLVLCLRQGRPGEIAGFTWGGIGWEPHASVRVAPGALGTTVCPRTGVGEDAGRKCLPPEHPAAGRWAGGSDAMYPAIAAGGTAEGDQRLPGDVCAFDSGNIRATVSRLHVQGAPTSHLCRAAMHCIGDLEAVNVNPSKSELFTESECSFQGHLVNVMLSVS